MSSQVQNKPLDLNRGPGIIFANFVFGGTAFVVVAFHLYTRFRIKAVAGWDDVLILIATVSTPASIVRNPHGVIPDEPKALLLDLRFGILLSRDRPHCWRPLRAPPHLHQLLTDDRCQKDQCLREHPLYLCLTFLPCLYLCPTPPYLLFRKEMGRVNLRCAGAKYHGKHHLRRDLRDLLLARKEGMGQ